MKLSIIIPTYNNDKTLYECLKAISEQDLNKKDYEVLLIDGGSSDRTLEIARSFDIKILNNPHRVEDAARIMSLKVANGEIIALIDADNVIVGKDWLRKMLAPFKDKEICCADTLYFSYRKSDMMKVRYQALIGGDDPMATYLGFYSRWCYFKDNWTDFPYKMEQKKGYQKVWITNPELIPSVGSNGFFIRKEIIKKYIKDTFTHPDYIWEMVRDGNNCMAKVDASIIHNQPTFFKNKIRRIKRRLRKEITVKYHYDLNNKKLFLLALRIITLLPITYDVIKGYIRKRDSAWIFHYPATIGLLAIYGFYKIREFFGAKIWK